MSIWRHTYGLRDIDTVKRLAEVRRCPYCSTDLTRLKKDRHRARPHDGASLTGTAFEANACMGCGWWQVWHVSTKSTSFDLTSETEAAVASLKNLDLMDLSTPIADIQSFLVARYETRFSLHPRLFEETVASVLRPEGFRSRVTAYTKDGGIDAIYEGPNDQLVGVQVKRYRGNVGVQQIREFTGALVVGDYTKGLFVNTSGFTSAAAETALAATERGYLIELIDAPHFLSALQIVQRRRYQDMQELLADIGEPTLQKVDYIRVEKPEP